jgi:hypothetical protein
MAPEEQVSTVHVSYTVKELFEDIKRELENLNVKLDNKADRVELLELAREVANIRTQFVTLQGMVTEVETVNNIHSENDKAKIEWNRWLIPTVLTIALLMLGVLQYVKTPA